MTMAVTKTSVFLFRRSFDFAQDDRFVPSCHAMTIDFRVSDQTGCVPKRHCHPDRSGGIS